MTEKTESGQLILAISGVKNSGKTTLITKILPELKRLGLNVAVIKHDGHDFQADIPGTDTWKMAEAGACGTLIFSEKKYMMVKYTPSPSIKELILEFPEADVILLEGFKYSDFPKLELIRKGNSRKPVCDPAFLCGIVTDIERNELKKQMGEENRISNIKVFQLEAVTEISHWIYQQWKERQ